MIAKPRIRKSTLYTFWLAEWTIGDLKLLASGDTPALAYLSLLSHPRAVNKAGWSLRGAP